MPTIPFQCTHIADEIEFLEQESETFDKNNPTLLLIATMEGNKKITERAWTQAAVASCL